VQPSGHHQMQDEEEVSLEEKDEALAQPSQPEDALTHGLLQGRLGGASEGGTTHPDTLQGLAQHASGERTQIDGEVRVLGHGHHNVAPVRLGARWESSYLEAKKLGSASERYVFSARAAALR
jgi:hypothetical protein